MNKDIYLARMLARENTVLIAIVEALAQCADQASNIYAFGLCERMTANVERIERLVLPLSMKR